MAEAAAVVGLIASIVTLVDLGAKIVSRIQDFTARTADIPQSFRTLAERLPILIRTLQQVQVRTRAGGVSNDVAQDLRTLVNSINVQIKVLEQCLEKITPSADASRLEKAVKALQSLTKDERVMHAVDKIHRGIDVLVLYQTTTSVDLGDRILQKLTRLDSHQTPLQQSLGLWLDRAPQLDPNAFLGRTAELRQLNEWLSPKGHSPSQKVVSIVGMGGLGKTQLSLAYVNQHGSQYSSVFWLNAQDKLSLQQSILTISCSIFAEDEDKANTKDSRDEERRVQRVRRWLSEPWNDRWLIIFDNYDDPALPNIRSPTGFNIREFFPIRAQGSILITTRSPKLLFSRQLALQKINDITVQVAILSQRAGRGLCHDVKAKQLASRLDGLPLALATAGSYIGQTGSSCTDYLDMYEKMWNKLHGDESEALLEYADRTLSSTWAISLEQVRRQDTDAVELLKFSTLLSNEDIWYELLREGAPDGPAWLDRVTTTKVRFDQALIRLRDYSLIEVIPGSYRVHPCVHDWLLECFQVACKESWFLAALSCIARSVPKEESLDYWTMAQRLIRQAQRLDHQRFKRLWHSCCSNITTIEASQKFAKMFQNFERFAEAEQMYTQALTGKDKALGPEHTSTLTTVNSLGVLYFEQDKLVEAEQMYTRALAGCEKALGAEHVLTLRTISYLASLYSKQERLIDAERMYTRALAGCEKAFEAEHTMTLYVVGSLGEFYSRQARLAEAEQMYTRALAGYDKVLGTEHTLTLGIVNNLRILYINQEKLPEAEQMYTRLLNEKKKALGTACSSKLDSMHYLGHCYMDHWKLIEAELTHTQALAGYERAVGAEHTSTLHTVNSFGVLYLKQDRLAEAEQMYTRALVEYEEALGAEHTSTLRTVHNLGHLYSKQDRLTEAEQMYTRALGGYEKVLGPEHTSTLEAVSTLGCFYYKQDKLAEAEQMYTRALAGCEKVLGLEHTSTHKGVNNLGCLYSKQDKLVEAEQMYLRALAGYEKALGMEHTLTLKTVYNLGLLYKTQGKLAEAEQMYTRTLAGHNRALGAEHTSTLDAAFCLGRLYSGQDRLMEAEQMYTRALAGYEKVLGTEHASTLDSIHNLGHVYAKQDRLTKAEQMYIRALAGYEQALESEHTAPITMLQHQASLYHDQGELVVALAECEKTLRWEHTSTLNIFFCLGRLYSRQDRLTEAEQMYTRALAGYEKALGSDHTSALTTVLLLGFLYSEQDRLAEAEHMYTRALAGFKKALGAEDALTLTTMNGLGLMYLKQGRLAEVEQIFTQAPTENGTAVRVNDSSIQSLAKDFKLLRKLMIGQYICTAATFACAASSWTLSTKLGYDTIGLFFLGSIQLTYIVYRLRLPPIT